MVVGERFQYAVGVLLVALLLVDAHAHERDVLARSVCLLHAVYGGEHLRIVFLRIVKANQNLEHVAAVAVVGVELFVGFDGAVVLTLVYVCLGYVLQIVVVVGLQLGSSAHILDGKRVVAAFGVCYSLRVVDLGGVGPHLAALLEQVEGSGVAVYLSAHGVEIESVEEWRLLQQRVG